jgi:hypothetical protein
MMVEDEYYSPLIWNWCSGGTRIAKQLVSWSSHHPAVGIQPVIVSDAPAARPPAGTPDLLAFLTQYPRSLGDPID